MAVYVGSGLGLLVTTSLLGLRRYLRQRKVKIPAALTASWLGLGKVFSVFMTGNVVFPGLLDDETIAALSKTKPVVVR